MNFAMLIRKREMAALTAIAAVVPIVAQEAWNGLVKTDMASIGATRDASQSKVIPAPAVPLRWSQEERLRFDGLAATRDCSAKGTTQLPPNLL